LSDRLLADAEVIDLDEEAYRAGEWRMRLFGVARVPREPEIIACGKIAAAQTEEEDLQGIAEHVRELMLAGDDTLFVFGPGSTAGRIARHCSLPKTLLGIDCYRRMREVALDVDGATLDGLAAEAASVALVLSPIGGQGFVVGRGNAPISAPLVGRAWPDSVHIVSTQRKLLDIEGLRFDTGDAALDARIRGARFASVVTDYRTKKLVRVL
jgi:predicted polyphosphate/ATP-dependent NAD kinase